MPARKQLTWSELRVGLLVIATLGLLAVFIFYVTGGGRIFTTQVHYETYLPDVAGLQPGAPVRLVGYAVGTVEGVGLSPYGDEPTRHAVVRFRIDAQYSNYVRTDSEAFITTEGLLGESVLEITRGVTGEAIPPGGEVPGTQRGNIKQIVQNTETITGDVRNLIADLRAGQGTLGKLFADPALYNRAASAVGDFQSLTAKAAAGEGSLGKLMVSEELYDQLRRTADNLEQMTNDVRAGKGTLGALLTDKKVYEQAANVVQRVDNIVTRVERGEGTLGKLLTDDALHTDVKNTFANASAITGRMKEGEGAAGRLINDPRLYDNVNEFTTEMRALLSDFRKNPKKYLRIKFSIF